jgi:hypothetical protein
MKCKFQHFDVRRPLEGPFRPKDLKWPLPEYRSGRKKNAIDQEDVPALDGWTICKSLAIIKSLVIIFSTSIVVGLVENVGAAAALYLRASRDRVALTCIIHQSKATIAWLSLTDNPPKTLFALFLLVVLFSFLMFRGRDTQKRRKIAFQSRNHL